MTTPNQEKISFILYGSYEEQLTMLTDEQAGRLLKSIYVYVRTGEKQPCEDTMVNLMLSVIGHQLDIDARKYEEKLERRKEAGRKGGIQKAKNLANASNAKNDVANASNAINFLANVAEDEDVDDDVYVDDDEDVDVNVDEDEDVILEKTGRRRQEDEEDAYLREDHEALVDQFVCCGDGVIPVLASELDRYKALANGLTRKYMNRSAKAFDIEKVIFYASRVEISPQDVVYNLFDIGRAELLEYVFERAAEQERMTWKYIDGIMDNYNRRNVTTVREAMVNEGMWQMGAIA